ncbi:hypothetical protein [Thermomonospora umbrina]|uniref:HicA-like toxin of HicAB toxin-antitoxin system n=1 Tax=Thermomonospora umbrina TaxID=111806 RepID=A0A3D9SWQ0_9ACTN|nr:hypothetical protein [Thermomonospora umbrina]REF00367.1 hypothetical protein DFJ69_5899 [Thermomonospora umbrina]
MSPNLRKELEAIRKEAVGRGWRVERGSKYWKMYCPCPKKCKKNMALTPSDPNYVINLLGQLRRATCWKDGEA